MKKILILVGILSLSYLVACTNYEANEVPNNGKDIGGTIYTFQGHQYVQFDGGTGSWGGHLANCNNPIHRQETLPIDLPEEVKVISRDSRHPTILAGFIDNDTLYIQFKN